MASEQDLKEIRELLVKARDSLGINVNRVPPLRDIEAAIYVIDNKLLAPIVKIIRDLTDNTLSNETDVKLARAMLTYFGSDK